MTEQEKLQVKRIADRLRSVAHDLRLASTISVHRKDGHVAYLDSEAWNLEQIGK